MELYVFFFNNGRPQTTCMLSMKFGTGIEDSLHYLYNNFGRHHSSTLPPPIGQIWACLFPPYWNSELFQKQVFTNFLYLSTNLDIEHHETNQEKKVASQTYDLRNHPSRTRKRIWRQSHQIGHEVITQIGDPGGLKEFFLSKFTPSQHYNPQICKLNFWNQNSCSSWTFPWTCSVFDTTNLWFLKQEVRHFFFFNKTGRVFFLLLLQIFTLTHHGKFRLEKNKQVSQICVTYRPYP